MRANDASPCASPSVRPSAAEQTLCELGFDAHDLAEIRRIVRQPEGIILAIGPAGSGRTATLHALLDTFDPDRARTRSAECATRQRPPEWWRYETGDKGNKGHNNGRDPRAEQLRRMLRSRPEAVLLAEIDSYEMAQTVLRAALAGCRVFSAMEGGRAYHAFARFRAWGVAPADLADQLLLVVAQRRVRALCRHCAVLDESEAVREALARATDGWQSPLGAREPMDVRMAKSGGCSHCGGEGYRGQAMVYEWIEVDSAVRSLIEEGVAATELERRLLSDGRCLWDRGLRLIANGRTSLDALRASVREPR